MIIDGSGWVNYSWANKNEWIMQANEKWKLMRKFKLIINM